MWGIPFVRHKFSALFPSDTNMFIKIETCESQKNLKNRQ